MQSVSDASGTRQEPCDTLTDKVLMSFRAPCSAHIRTGFQTGVPNPGIEHFGCHIGQKGQTKARTDQFTESEREIVNAAAGEGKLFSPTSIAAALRRGQ